MIKNGNDTAEVYGPTHPYTYMSYIMDVVGDYYGEDARATCVTIRGRTKIRFRELPKLFLSGNLCVNVETP